MNQGIFNNSVEFLQKHQSTYNNGLKTNILEITRLIDLLDCPYNEILSYLSEDISYIDELQSAKNWNNKRSLSNSNSFTSNKSEAARVTQDLDHLLTSLSQYKLNQSSSGNLYDGSSIGPEYLYSENMNNTNSSATSSVGSRNTEKTYEKTSAQKPVDEKFPSIPSCALCHELIYDNSINALDVFWHQHHFICFSCKTSLESVVYYVDNQQPYCEGCHINLFTDKCAYCNEPILDTSLTALDQHWHPEHFFCSSCQGPFENDTGFHEHLHKPYCADCYFDLFGSRCAGCKEPITSTFLSAMGQKWHDYCFVCKLFSGSWFSNENILMDLLTKGYANYDVVIYECSTGVAISKEAAVGIPQVIAVKLL